ncbi:MAG: flagellar motor switch protein FliM [Desulfobacterales bacterium]|nr:flagellar motor switch protein FliM [Desulfobacterales bacterium]
MSENVLSQDEIDALLGAMDEGEVDFDFDAPEEQSVEIKEYDLMAQGAMLRHQFYALEEVYDKFSSLLETTMSASLHKPIGVELVSTEMVKYGEFIQAFSNPTSFAAFTMDPLIGSSLLAIEPSLVYSLIDCMFGGDGKPFEDIREFTFIEKRMMAKFSVEIFHDLEKAWEIVFPVKVTIKKTETKPEYVHLVSPEDLLIVIVLSVTGAEFSGNMHLCVSYRMLEPIKDKLSSKYLREKDLVDAFSHQLQSLIRETDVTIVSELGCTYQTVRDLLNMKVNDIIRLDKGPADPLSINVENVPKYQGFPGIVKGNRAVQLTAMLT